MKSDANLLIGEVKGWEEMGGQERGEWMKVMGIEGEREEVGKGEEKEEGKGEREEEREEKEGDAVGDLGEGRWMAVRCGGGEEDESLILDGMFPFLCLFIESISPLTRTFYSRA